MSTEFSGHETYPCTDVSACSVEHTLSLFYRTFCISMENVYSVFNFLVLNCNGNSVVFDLDSELDYKIKIKYPYLFALQIVSNGISSFRNGSQRY